MPFQKALSLSEKQTSKIRIPNPSYMHLDTHTHTRTHTLTIYLSIYLLISYRAKRESNSSYLVVGWDKTQFLTNQLLLPL